LFSRRASADPAAAAQARELIGDVPFWWHSIEVAPGVITPGQKTPEQEQHELETFKLPELRGKSVLDIGGWDGFYAFQAESRGAARVAVLDHYVWSIDRRGLMSRTVPNPPEEERRLAASLEQSKFWRPDTLPGKEPFDLARRLRGSAVGEIVGDFMTIPLEEVGAWDVTFFLGVLYHLRDPFGGLMRLASMTTEMSVIETQAVSVGGYPQEQLWQFYPTDELNGDPTNWFAPTPAALEGALLAAGFRRVQMLVDPPTPAPGEIAGYRAVAHAFK
jgi:tRNA (mo5U34)-methyltransferase